MEREHLSKTDSYLSDFLDYLKNEKLYTNDTLKNYQIDLKQISEFLHSKNQDLYTADRLHIETWVVAIYIYCHSSPRFRISHSCPRPQDGAGIRCVCGRASPLRRRLRVLSGQDMCSRLGPRGRGITAAMGLGEG